MIIIIISIYLLLLFYLRHDYPHVHIGEAFIGGDILFVGDPEGVI